MIEFVNAKINIGLQVVNRREDGYHDLETVFYPVGLYAGTPENPERFCDILEVRRNDRVGFNLRLEGNPVACPMEKHLVYRAAKLFFDTIHPYGGADIAFVKNLPDGAGMGGGSADASFTLKMLADAFEVTADLKGMAMKLGADCPFFIDNRPAYAEGVGEKLEPINLDLSGYWLTVVKPDVSISTKEAFAGIVPHNGAADLRKIAELPIEEWQGVVKNDFEDSIFPKHPFMKGIKEDMRAKGALYASLTGSGSCIYGIFGNREAAELAKREFSTYPTIKAAYLLKM